MRVIAKVSRMIGVDQLHVGTAVGKMSESKTEVMENCNALKRDMNGLIPVMPVASGGLHPGLVPELIEFFGVDCVLQAGGGIHGHRDGTKAGAQAMRQAIDATLRGAPLREYAKTHRELATALQTWGDGSA
jgi:ribulose-bisphosphate carboxylase large chain